MANLIWICLVVIISFSKASFVRKVAPNEFQLDLEENGVRITQKVRYENGLKITEVPAHHNRAASTFVFDDKTGLMLTEIPSAEACYIQIPFFAMNFAREDHIASNPKFVNDKASEYLLINSSNTIPLELVSVIGPELDREDLPLNMAHYCNESYRVFTLKEVPANPQNVKKLTSDGSHMILDDPLFKKEVRNGEPIPDFSELFQVLPPSNRSRRFKRSVCRKPDMSIVVENCEWKYAACPPGLCTGQAVNYDCKNKRWNCQYILLCTPTNMTKKCIMHISNGNYFCRVCCSNANCGNEFPKCPYDESTEST